MLACPPCNTTTSLTTNPLGMYRFIVHIPLTGGITCFWKTEWGSTLLLGDVAQWQRVRFACGRTGVQSPSSPSNFRAVTCSTHVGCFLDSIYSSVAEHSIAESTFVGWWTHLTFLTQMSLSVCLQHGNDVSYLCKSWGTLDTIRYLIGFITPMHGGNYHLKAISSSQTMLTMTHLQVKIIVTSAGFEPAPTKNTA